MKTIRVWAPPGVSLLTSSGVLVQTITPEAEPADLYGIEEEPPDFMAESGDRPKRKRSPKAVHERIATQHRSPNWSREGMPKYWATEVETEGAWEASDTLTVPPEMEELAQRAMERYDMSVSGMKLFATKPEKGGAIWRIDTDKGPRSLKVLHRPPERSLFSVAAQDYLVERGARVPALVANQDGDLYTIIDGKMWIVTDWVEQLVPATKDLAGAQALCYGLGEFHKLSRGYVPPHGARVASRLMRWPRTYQKIITKMDWFRTVAQAYPEMPASPAVLEVVDMFEGQAREALERLERSAYPQLVARGNQAWGLVHQDR